LSPAAPPAAAAAAVAAFAPPTPLSKLPTSRLVTDPTVTVVHPHARNSSVSDVISSDAPCGGGVERRQMELKGVEVGD
jgi:hypothetical protein